MSKKGSFEKKNLKFDESLVFIFSSPEDISAKKNIITSSLCHGPLFFFLLEHLFCLSHCKTRWTMSVNNVGLKIRLLQTPYSMVILTFSSLGVNRTNHVTSSTANHRLYRAWGRLHGPWCKQPLSRKVYTNRSNQCVLLWGVTQSDNILLKGSISAKKKTKLHRLFGHYRT